jgi:outer membrane immunogenic protein
MKSFVIASLIAAALSAPAVGADVALPIYKPPVPMMNWTGCYVGADAGAGWSAQDVTNSASAALGSSRSRRHHQRGGSRRRRLRRL